MMSFRLFLNSRHILFTAATPVKSHLCNQAETPPPAPTWRSQAPIQECRCRSQRSPHGAARSPTKGRDFLDGTFDLGRPPTGAP